MTENDPSRLDAETALRLLSDVQRFGLQAATEVAARFSRLAADEAQRFSAQAAIRPDLASVTSNIEAGWASFSRVLDASFAPSRSSTGRAAETPSAVVAGPIKPGGDSEVQIWLHNMTTEPRIISALRVSEMLSGRGDALASGAVSAKTTLPTVIEPGSSTSVTIAVAIAADVIEGSYHGLIVATPHGEAPLPLTVTVRS